ncbi:MAG TPA: hydroxymethylglutaryl-CoA reductase, degradative [Saprospiraceae bacterium]|nr:hydroxymethylglutaryl-CoA reductase, degradative [Saprospiraceae bacterium]HPI05193.1 hydroxymethylglutaryl-CoA reductase, degradative [Saprospiraceae bacterium]
MSKTISGFSKLGKQEKINWLAEHFSAAPQDFSRELSAWQHPDAKVQGIVDGFTENAIANYVLPYSIAPNFVINGKTYAVPMVIEESSVVAAASSAAKFWQERGGFHAEVIGTVKLGQVHFRWFGGPERLREIFPKLQSRLLDSCADLVANMEKRGGGVRGIELIDFRDVEPDYYQLRVAFETCDSMGANFVNSVLERFAETLEAFFTDSAELADTERDVEVIMSILSNYTPDCLVRAWVECPIAAFADLARSQGMDAGTLAERFALAVRIAQIDPYRATTHNKGIYNGIDAVVLATGNDFRAIEACGHTYAARDGQYRSLSRCTVENGLFHFELEIPLAMGTVGGLTALHPLAKRSLEILGHPSARELMCITAVVGLAQNFGAVRSLITTGIQQGHMKMHLTNILNHLGASPEDAAAAQHYFQAQTVSFSSVRAFLEGRRVTPNPTVSPNPSSV